MKNKNNFFKPIIGKVILTIVIFILLIIFLLPAKLNVLCKTGVPCPPVNHFIKITEVSNNPYFVSLNYLYLLIELIISYLISCIIITGYSKLTK